MKVLLITDNHSPNAGGAEKYFFKLKEILTEHPALEVVSLGFHEKNTHTPNTITLKESSKFTRFFWRLLLNPLKYWQIRKIIQQVQPDVIHLHNIKKYMVTLLKAVQGYPVVQTTHDYSLICPSSWNLHRNLQPCKTGFTFACLWQHRIHYSLPLYLASLFAFFKMRRLTKKSVQQFLPPSPLLADYLHRQGFQPARAIFPPQPPRPLMTIPTEANHFLFLGQFGLHKGIDCLLEEFALACQKAPRLKLTLVGKGKKETALHEKIKKLKLSDQVTCLGWQKDPSHLYEKASAIIVPSLWLESFGLVVTEAMSHGRAVIGSRRSTLPWLIDDEKTGLLFDPLKKGDLAACILKLANNLDLVKEYGKNAHQKYLSFPTNEIIAKEFIAVYENALQKRK